MFVVHILFFLVLCLLLTFLKRGQVKYYFSDIDFIKIEVMVSGVYFMIEDAGAFFFLSNLF